MKYILGLAAIAATFTGCSHFQITRIEPHPGKGFAVSLGAGILSIEDGHQIQREFDQCTEK